LPPAVGQSSVGSVWRSCAEKFGAVAMVSGELADCPPAPTVTVFVAPGVA
jgi:hypothetical protein